MGLAAGGKPVAVTLKQVIMSGATVLIHRAYPLMQGGL